MFGGNMSAVAWTEEKQWNVSHDYHYHN